MTNRTPADVGLSHLTHLDRTLDTRVDILLFERILQGKRIHDRCHHAHIVRRRAIHALCTARKPAPDIAAANHNGDIDAMIAYLLDLRGNLLDNGGIDAEPLISCQSLSAEFQNDTAIFRFHDDSSCLFFALL